MPMSQKKDLNEKKSRPIDDIAVDSYSWWGRNFVLIKKKYFQTFLGSILIAFLAGMTIAITWSLSNNCYPITTAIINPSLKNYEQEETKKPKIKEAGYSQETLIVKLREEGSMSDLGELNKKHKVNKISKLYKEVTSPESHLQLIEQQLFEADTEKQKEKLKKELVRWQKTIDRAQVRKSRAPESSVAPKLDKIYSLKFYAGDDVKKLASVYKKHPSVEYVQLDYITTYNEFPQNQPNDSYFYLLWAMKNTGQIVNGVSGVFDADIDAVEAWAKTGSQLGGGVTIAVVDTGIYYDHEDLYGNVWINNGEIAGNGIDDDSNGYIDDNRGWDVANNDNDPMDYSGHGTHVSGTIAAMGNNSKGVIGVAPQALVMPVKAFTDGGYGNSSYSAQAIVYAANNGADVINNSWSCAGRCENNPVVEDAVLYANSMGAVVIFASGNEYDDARYYSPQNMKETIVVASIDQNDINADSSNYGVYVDVGAPGRNIASTHLNNEYWYMSGTSMAAPHVSGLSALILSDHSAFNIEEIRSVIRSSTDDILSAGFDIYSGYGRINAEQALSIDSPSIAVIDSPINYTYIQLNENSVNVTGTAAGSNFQSYSVFNKKVNSSTWNLVSGPITSSVENGVLVNLDVNNLFSGESFLRLLVTNLDGSSYENIIQIERQNMPTVVTVLDENSQPLNGILVNALNSNNSFLDSGLTDAQGNITLDIDEGTEVYFSATFYYPRGVGETTQADVKTDYVTAPSNVIFYRPYPTTNITVTNSGDPTIRIFVYDLSDNRIGFSSTHNGTSNEIFPFYLKEGQQFYIETCISDSCGPGDGILSDVYIAPENITVDISSPPPVDGQWCPWNECSVECDGGVQSRECACPAPANGGLNCVGDSTQVCNEDPCGSECGDGYCAGFSTGEDCYSCPADCVSGQLGSCGACWKGVCDGSCNSKKETSDCADCAANYCCGDGTCQTGENTTNCHVDCGCSVNSDCNDGETCTNDICDNGVCKNLWPACGLDDGCCGQTCSPATDPDCQDCSTCFKGICDGNCNPAKETSDCPDCL